MNVKYGLALFLVLILLSVLFYREHKYVTHFDVNSWTMDHQADCGVVFTGGPGRVREGIDLLEQENIQKLIISGVNPGVEFFELLPHWQVYGNLKIDDIILEKASRTTYGNVQQMTPIVEAIRCKSIILITSRLHMFRVSKTVAKVFPEDFPIFYRALPGGKYESEFGQEFVETIKSLFYSIWAY